MAKAKNEVNKSEEVRKLLKANPRITAKDVIASLGDKGIDVSAHLYYFVKGQLKGRKKKAQKMVAKVAETTGRPSGDAVTTIRKVKAFAGEVGGMKNLKALVDALSE